MKITAFFLACCLVLPVGLLSPCSAEAKERHAAAHFGLGTAAVISTVGYGTIKIVYATLGSITGGLAWVLTGGRSDVARAIIQPAVRGDYVVTPDHLMSEQPLVFTGRDPRAESYQY